MEFAERRPKSVKIWEHHWEFEYCSSIFPEIFDSKLAIIKNVNSIRGFFGTEVFNLTRKQR